MNQPEWIKVMDRLEAIRLFSSLYIKKTKKGELTSMQQVDALFRIALADGITPLALSREMGTSKTIISRLVEQLSGKDFIVKKYGEKDRRSYSLFVTTKGREELRGMCRYYLEPVYELQRQMEPDSFAQLFKLLDQANEIMKKSTEEII